jgi:hypothetical protein
MKPFIARERLKGCKTKERAKKEEITMKIRTKIAIFLIATVLSLAGYGVLANALSVDRVMAAATPTTVMSVHITG